MIHVTCRLTAKNRDQLLNPALSNRAWATFTFLIIQSRRATFGVLRAGGQRGVLLDGGGATEVDGGAGEDRSSATEHRRRFRHVRRRVGRFTVGM